MSSILCIATTAFFNDRGCHIRIMNIAGRLRDKKILCYAGGRDMDGIASMRIAPLFGSIDIIGFSWRKLILDFMLLIRGLRAMRDERFGKMLAFTHEAGFIAMILSAVTKKEYILDYQGSMSHEMKLAGVLPGRPPFIYAVRFLEHMIESKAELIIYNTYFAYNNSLKENKMIIDDRRFNPPAVKSIKSFREASETIVLWMGVFSDVQGIDALAEIIEQTGASDVKFIVVGFPVTDNITEQLNGENVILTGRVPWQYIPGIIKDADICISTKNRSSEGSGKLHLFKQYCSNVIALRNRASEEILMPDEIADSTEEIVSRIKNWSN
ncbi:MAG: hypothetical protein SVK54_03950 [candidate division WOR-3 bacterium]|nr:hypothetical protein [candidate division WOR-3 bacterium]